MPGEGRGSGGKHSHSCSGNRKAWGLSCRYTLLLFWERGVVVMARYTPSSSGKGTGCDLAEAAAPSFPRLKVSNDSKVSLRFLRLKFSKAFQV